MKRKGEGKTEGEEGCPTRQKLETNGHNYDEDDDDRKGPSQGKHNRIVEGRRDCPYLDSVNRKGELEVVEEIHGGAEGNNVVTETSRMPFLMLGLDLPPPPLFKDVMEKNIIPQVPLLNLLKKFDGEFVTEAVRPRIARMRYRVTRLPQYLILHMHRFMENNSFKEKNPTLVNFPVKNLELKDYILLPTPKEEKSRYDLIANVVHDGGVHDGGEGSYRVSVHCKSEQQWYEMQDLHVSETLPQMVALSEAYMQIYEQQR